MEISEPTTVKADWASARPVDGKQQLVLMGCCQL